MHDSTLVQLREKTDTLRVSSPSLEEILYIPIKVLDHGFVRVIDYMGDDSAIVQAARVSYGVGTTKTQEDRGLINYLMRHRHTTPFEMCEIKFHIKLPIFVARQWLRHRTANVNEYSARYSILSNEFYTPDASVLAKQSSSNKQGRESSSMDPQITSRILQILENSNRSAYEQYTLLLQELELTRELARTVLPLSIYTEMYWKIDLHNLLHFLQLRADNHAQYEIKCYADVILDILKQWVPMTYEAFMNYRKGSVVLSRQNLCNIKRMLSGEKVDFENSGLSKGEWREFCEIFLQN